MDSRRILHNSKLLMCPYDPLHRVEEGTRYQRHLIECQKNHPDVQELICPFNRTHRIPIAEFPYHRASCPDNYIVQREIIHVKNDFQMKPLEDIEITKFDPPPSSEDWEKDLLPEPICIQTMNLQNNKQIKFVNSDVLSGLKPRQKKKFRKNLAKEGIKFNFSDDSDEAGEAKENHVEQEQKQGKKHSLQQKQQQQQIDANTEPSLSKLKQIRTPSEVPMAAAPTLPWANAGRGLNPAFRNPRIAANIFGGASSNILPDFGPSNPLATAGIGRGQMLVEAKKNLVGKNNNIASAKDLNETTSDLSAQMADAHEKKDDTPITNVTDKTEELNTSNDFKTRRKLEKKLKQIEVLEKKIEEQGISSLNMDEVNKINSKKQIMEQLEKLKGQNVDK